MLRYRYVISGGVGGPYLCVMHFSNSATTQGVVDAGGGKVKNFWDAMKGFWISTMQGSLDPNVDVVDPDTGELLQQFVTTTTPQVGTLTPSDLLPPATQGIFKWTTNAFVAGRRVRGRTYFPGLNESHNTGGGVPGGSWVLSQPGVAIAALLATGDPSFAIWSRPVTSPPAPSPRIGTIHTVTAGAVDTTKWAILKSRRS